MAGDSKMTGNYEKQVFLARDIFLKYDRKAITDKFQLESDEEYIYIQLLDRMYRVSAKDGAVEAAKNNMCGKKENREKENACEYELCLDYNVVMTIYDVLCYSKEKPKLAGEWCPLQNLQVTLSSPDADTFTQKYAEHFSGKSARLQEACRRIGGRKPEISAGADVCWEFDIFPFFPVQLRFWEKDEEFPPQIRLLWDKNSLKFMHFETLYYVMHLLLDHLRKSIRF